MRATGWLAGATAAAVLACGPGEPVAPEEGGGGAGGTAPPRAATLKVELVGNGAGHVTSTPRGIDCPGVCSMTLPAGVHVSFDQKAGTDSAFVGWGGACSGAGACGFDSSSDLTLWANFEQRRPATVQTSSSCAGIAPPQNVPMQQFVHDLDHNWFVCLSGVGDGSGTLALPRRFSDPNAHGFAMDVATAGRTFLGDHSLGTLNRLALFGEPRGFAAVGGPGYLGPRDFLFVGSWDPRGNPTGNVAWSGSAFASAAGPSGAIVVAGDLGKNVGGKQEHAAAMFSGSSEVAVKWGPKALASPGAVFGVGVDQLDRALVITNGAANFGPGTISAQWFAASGTTSSGEFVLLTAFVPGDSTWFETTALIGGGLLVRRMDLLDDGLHASPLVVVDSGSAKARAVPDWMAARRDSILQMARGGRAYAVLPLGARGVACTQRVEVVAADGTSCGAADYAIANGTCDTLPVTLGFDGTIIQQLPTSMETTDPIHANHTCTWRWWPGALR